MMVKNVYLIITDVHLSCLMKANRTQYREEMRLVKRKIFSLIRAYKTKYENCKINIMFLGDIFDRGYSDVIQAIQDNNFFVNLWQIVENIYAVVGNHELSFSKDNPFYSLVTEIQSEKIKALRSNVWQPQGLMPVINVVDRLEDGNVVFLFNHYGTPISDPEEGKCNIGLFHQDIACKEIIADVEAETGMSVFTKMNINSFDEVRTFNNYDYCFLGHNHKLYGIWNFTSPYTMKTTTIQYLSNLIRVTHDEINNNALERDIPAVVVENGNLVGVEHNTFELPRREECVDEEVVTAMQENREKIKEKKEALAVNYGLDDPIVNLRNMMCTPMQVKLLNEYIDAGSSLVCDEILERVRRISK